MFPPFTVLDPDYTIEELIAYLEERYAALAGVDAVERLGLIGKYLITAVGLDFDYVAGNATQIFHSEGPEREACTEATIRFCAKFTVYMMNATQTERALTDRVSLFNVLIPRRPTRDPDAER